MEDETDAAKSEDSWDEDDERGFVEQLLGAPAARPVRWNELEPAEAARMLEELGEWVCWLGSRYQLDGREVPACWWRHGAVLEELTGLWGSWLVAYDDGQSAAAMADWHRHFNETRIRLREWLSRTGCSAHEHRDGSAQPWLDGGSELWWADFIDHVGRAGVGDHTEPGRDIDGAH